MTDQPLAALEYVERYLIIDRSDMVAQTFLWSLTISEDAGVVRDAGVAVYRRMAALGDLLAAHKLATLTGEGSAASKGDPAYAERIYDDMATRFEDKLVAHLGYRGPWILRDMLLNFLGISSTLFTDDSNMLPVNPTNTTTTTTTTATPISSKTSTSSTLSEEVKSLFPALGSWRVLDIGCGSGLVGKVFHAFTRADSITSPTAAIGDTEPCSGESSDIIQLVQWKKRLTSIASASGHLAGIDVSQKMVDITRGTGLYDVVVKGDLLDALRLYRPTQPSTHATGASALTASMTHTNSERSMNHVSSSAGFYHMLIAADTFIYVGALGGVLQAARYALRSGGLLLFSVEDLDTSPLATTPNSSTSVNASNTHTASGTNITDLSSRQHHVGVDGEIEGAVPGWGARLLHSARFAHSHAYIQALATIHGYTIVSRRHEMLRLESTQPQPGIFYILQMNTT